MTYVVPNRANLRTRTGDDRRRLRAPAEPLHLVHEELCDFRVRALRTIALHPSAPRAAASIRPLPRRARPARHPSARAACTSSPDPCARRCAAGCRRRSPGCLHARPLRQQEPRQRPFTSGDSLVQRRHRVRRVGLVHVVLPALIFIASEAMCAWRLSRARGRRRSRPADPFHRFLTHPRA